LSLKRETNDLKSNKLSTSHSRRRSCCWYIWTCLQHTC